MAAMQNLYWLINSYLAFYIFHFSFWHFSMTTLLQLGVCAGKMSLRLLKCIV